MNEPGARELAGLGPQLPAVARTAIRSQLEPHGAGEVLPANVERAPAAPVFVTLRSADGSLRGCIGSLQATESDVFRETARSARLAAARDPRFAPLTAGELANVSVEVSVLMPREPVTSLGQLDPKRFGVVVSDASGRRGLLLPDIDGIVTAEQQVAIARRKAGIEPGVPVQLQRFEVLKFVE